MRVIVIAISSLCVFALTAYDRPASKLSSQAAGLVLPLPADLLLSAGDRYLAANLNFLRAAVTPLNAPGSLQSRAQLHTRVARLNAKHEDNYYFASGGLVWMGEVDVGQSVLAMAALARYWDPLPYFFQGANEVYFNRDFLAGGRLVGLAAGVAQGRDKTFFTDLSAKLYSRSENLDIAIQYIRLLANGTTSKAFKQLLVKRVQRLEYLKELRASAKRYSLQTGKPLQRFDQLINAGIRDEIPVDPTGIGYELDPSGLPTLTREKP